MGEKDNPLFSEDELLPISALCQLMFCERRVALIHIEQVWSENRFTAEGRVLHERVHGHDAENRGDVHIARGLRLRSLRLGLVGQADVVEYHRQPDGSSVPFPVEFKRGKPKPDSTDTIQLCAQALCLEEMMGVSVPVGAMFYGKPRRRQEVVFTPELRASVEDTARRLHELIERGITPPAVCEKKCESCSLLEICRPRDFSSSKSVRAYLQREIVS